jgi:hypothetical protein
MRKRNATYKQVIPDPIEEIRVPGTRRIMYSNVIIDYRVFQKTPEERLALKNAKARHKRQISH